MDSSDPFFLSWEVIVPLGLRSFVAKLENEMTGGAGTSPGEEGKEEEENLESGDAPFLEVCKYQIQKGVRKVPNFPLKSGF